MKEKQIRKLRTYKINDKPYNKAKDRAEKEGGDALATRIETWVQAYAAGYDIISEVPSTRLKVKFPNNKSI